MEAYGGMLANIKWNLGEQEVKDKYVHDSIKLVSLVGVLMDDESEIEAWKLTVAC